MGRSFLSVRQGVRIMAGHWMQAARHLGRHDRNGAETLAGMAAAHSSAAFYGCDNPLEAAGFSALVAIRQEMEGGDRVDP